mmetsp:Transcript_10134/g.22810  ORF Transcript_10134/g.22810 Transcript_10134/m.22810 type:complete len:235 (+) Transcript_10134:1124-1828(+)
MESPSSELTCCCSSTAAAVVVVFLVTPTTMPGPKFRSSVMALMSVTKMVLCDTTWMPDTPPTAVARDELMLTAAALVSVDSTDAADAPSDEAMATSTSIELLEWLLDVEYSSKASSGLMSLSASAAMLICIAEVRLCINPASALRAWKSKPMIRKLKTTSVELLRSTGLGAGVVDGAPALVALVVAPVSCAAAVVAVVEVVVAATDPVHDKQHRTSTTLCHSTYPLQSQFLIDG